MAGNMVNKTDTEIEGEMEKREDELVIEELRKIADTCVDMFETEMDSPALHPELENKVPILDMAVWMERVCISARGLEEQDLHSSCDEDGTCLPIGAPRRRLEGEEEPAKRLVQQVFFVHYDKPMKPKRTMMESSANSWQQKRTTLTQELMRRLRNTKKELSCQKKQQITSDFMQIMKNSGYSGKFRREILMSALNGYNKILEAEKSGEKPMYRMKDWRSSARWLENKRKARHWLGPKYKSCIFVPPTPNSELQKLMQMKEEEMRAGGREDWAIKVIETAGRSLEKCLVNSDPLRGNQCSDKSCLPARNTRNKISCRRNNVGYRISCKICLLAGKQKQNCGVYIGETGENMHVRMKSHLTKFNSKKTEIQESSAFWKHLKNEHEDLPQGWKFGDCFEVEIRKAYNKPITRQTEEGIFMVNEKGELLNSKSEWNQPKIIRSTIHSGGAELAGGRMQLFPLAGRPESQGRAETPPCLRAGEAGEDRSRGGRLGGEGGQVQEQQGVRRSIRRSSRISG